MTSTIAPDAGPSDHASQAAVRGSNKIAPAVAVLSVVGAIGGYVVGRYAGVEPLFYIAFVWWAASAIGLSLLAKRSVATTAIVSLFLFLFVGLPIAAAASTYGVVQRAAAVLEDEFSDFSTEFDTSDGEFEPVD